MTKDEIINRIADINKAVKQLEAERDEYYYAVAVRDTSTRYDIYHVPVPKQTLMMCLLVEKECLEEELKKILSNG